MMRSESAGTDLLVPKEIHCPVKDFEKEFAPVEKLMRTRAYLIAMHEMEGVERCYY